MMALRVYIHTYIHTAYMHYITIPLCLMLCEVFISTPRSLIPFFAYLIYEKKSPPLLSSQLIPQFLFQPAQSPVPPNPAHSQFHCQDLLLAHLQWRMPSPSPGPHCHAGTPPISPGTRVMHPIA